MIVMRGFVRSCAVLAALAVALVAPARAEERPGCSPAVDPSGSRLAYLEYDASKATFTLVVETLASRQRTVVDDGLAALQPAWSPDGKLLAYPKLDGAPAVAIFDTASGARRMIAVDVQAPPAAVAWVSSTRLAVAGDTKIRVLDTGTGQVVLSRDLAPLTPVFASLSVNSAGDALFSVAGGRPERSSLWVLPLRADAAPRRLTSGHYDVSPVWLDDDRILFSRGSGAEGGEWHLWLLDARTGKARQVTTGAVADLQPSAGGQTVFYTRAPKGAGIVDFVTGARIVSLPRRALDSSCAVSPAAVEPPR